MAASRASFAAKVVFVAMFGFGGKGFAAGSSRWILHTRGSAREQADPAERGRRVAGCAASSGYEVRDTSKVLFESLLIENDELGASDVG